MPNIHGALELAPKLKPKSGGEKLKDAFGVHGGRAKRKAGRAAGAKFGNLGGSKRAENMETGGKMGKEPPMDPGTDWTNPKSRGLNRYHGALLGGGAGLLGGSVVGSAVGTHKYPESKKFNQVALNKGLKLPKLKPVERPHLITDAKTAGERYNNRAHPEWPVKSMIGAGAVGTALGYSANVDEKKRQATYVKNKQKRQAKLVKSYEKIPTSKEKGLSYADEGARARSIQQTRDNYKFRGPHGSENKKLHARAVGGGALIGAAGGAALGRVSGHVPGAVALGAGLGALEGSAVGSVRRSFRATKRSINTSIANGDVRKPKANERTNMRGVIEPRKVKKNMSMSAFGVDHGVVSKAGVMAPTQPKKPQPMATAPKPMSAGRATAGTVFGPYHGLVAGKGVGGKAKSAGTQYGMGMAGTIGGAAVGAGAGALTRNPMATAVGGALGSLGGGLAGSHKGTQIANNKGWLKPQKRQ